MPRDLRNEREARVCMADACSSGDRPCPVPDACRLPEVPNQQRSPWDWSGLGIAVLIVMCFAGFVFLGPMSQAWLRGYA